MATFGNRRRERETAELEQARKEIAALQAQVRDAQSEAETLRKENLELQAAVSRLEIKLRDLRPDGAFVAGHGVLWRQSADGRIEPLAYCPACRLVMTPFPSGYPETLICTQCKFKAGFRPEEIPKLVQEVAGA